MSSTSAINPPPNLDPKQAAFVSGSIMRHVLVMTGTSAIGLVSIFVVDALNLLYVSWLNKPELTAAVGYASTVAWFFIALGIGLSIATSILVSRAMGAGDRKKAGVIASGALLVVAAMAILMCLLASPLLSYLLGLLGAHGDTHRFALRFLYFQLPSVPLLALGMALGGILRAVGDAKRAMWVTLFPAIILAILDPILIFTLKWELDGAAIGLVAARVGMVVIGLSVIVYVHRLLTPPTLATIKALFKPFFAIGLPATLTQVASPVANAVVTSSMASFGDDAVGGWAVIGRLIPMAFGVMFALSGSIGPIMGQNYGAKRFDRIRETIMASMKVTAAYCLGISVVLAFASSTIAASFGAVGVGREVVIFFCIFLASSFVFQGAMFVANAAFNALGYATYSTWLNWGRATLGVVPFVWLGGHWFGPKGIIAGYSFGGVLFGVISLWLCAKVLREIQSKNEKRVLST
jgi:putative MATE family efflux protein